jgi:hypothetical protein
MLQLKSVIMVSISRISVRNTCCARGHDKMDTSRRGSEQHIMQSAMHNKRAACFGLAGPSSVRSCAVQCSAEQSAECDVIPLRAENSVNVQQYDVTNRATCFDTALFCAEHRLTSSVHTFTV